MMDNNFYNDHRHGCDDAHNNKENDDIYYNVYDHDVFLDSYFSHLPRTKLFSLVKGVKDIKLLKLYLSHLIVALIDSDDIYFISAELARRLPANFLKLPIMEINQTLFGYLIDHAVEIM